MKVDPDTGAISWENPKVAEDYIFLPAIQGTGGDAFYCGKELGHIIKVGEIIYLERWDQVDCNSNHFCVKGLHVGNEDYIRGWQNGAGCITLNVVVHPMDIGAISNGESVARVKRYQVLSVKSPEIENRNFYHTSVLTELAQKEYKVNIEEMLNAQDERMAKLQKELEHEKSFIINDIA